MQALGRRLLVLAIFSLAFTACKKKPAADGLAGSGVQAKKTRAVPAFSRLSVASRLEVWVTVDKDGPMELKGDDNLLEHVTARLENGVLRLDTDTKVRTKMPLEVRLTTKSLEAATAVAASRLDIQGLKADGFEARTGGAGRITAAGAAQSLKLSGKTAGQLDFTKVPAASASITLEDAATARMGYLEKLEVKLSGPSRVFYQGEPELKKDIKKPAHLIQRTK